MQVETERGLIYVEAEYQNIEQAQRDGYTYAFTSKTYGDILASVLMIED